MVFFYVVCVCQVVLNITVIVFLNKKCSFTNEELVKAVVLFSAFNILSVFMTLKSNAKYGSSKQFVLLRYSTLYHV